MKKQYVAPEIEKIEFEIQDIITHSLATGEGDTGGRVPWKVDGKNLIDQWGNVYGN
ncbi:MAG: hypothetical protein IKM32_01030 [Clostridia bacterium]|nr:hypothetical protein [Clostridia bacterium]